MERYCLFSCKCIYNIKANVMTGVRIFNADISKPNDKVFVHISAKIKKSRLTGRTSVIKYLLQIYFFLSGAAAFAGAALAAAAGTAAAVAAGVAASSCFNKRVNTTEAKGIRGELSIS